MAGVRRSEMAKKNRRMRVIWTRTALTAAACLALVLFAARGFSPTERLESTVVRSEAAAPEMIPAAEETAAPAPAETTPAPTAIPDLRKKEERDKWRTDTACTMPSVAGDMLLPTQKGGTPDIPPETYDAVRKKWEAFLLNRDKK